MLPIANNASTPGFVAPSVSVRCKLKNFVANACNYGRVALQAMLDIVNLPKFSLLHGISLCICADCVPRQDC